MAATGAAVAHTVASSVAASLNGLAVAAHTAVGHSAVVAEEPWALVLASKEEATLDERALAESPRAQ